MGLARVDLVSDLVHQVRELLRVGRRRRYARGLAV
eukprot:CAMPEP_0115887068 /NCGR_PEP_ID=MMETSP0287-20121206/31561_1 /TAXON_ID=412157 /ORGANISM="Chrysochromulina rotalis, Strain UIO044" /LENGTH=34 /DNA_ID= /DNA_START= /DNA_END= /DNA_ORIENTATION=